MIRDLILTIGLCIVKEKGSVSYLSAILHIYAKLGRKRSRFSSFAFFTKHFCKLKHYHLRIVTMAFAKRNHGICDA